MNSLRKDSDEMQRSKILIATVGPVEAPALNYLCTRLCEAGAPADGAIGGIPQPSIPQAPAT